MSDSWNEVEQFYHAALEREPADRSAFLDQNCPDDEVRREVQSLLKHEQEGDRLLEKAPWRPDRGSQDTKGEASPALAAGQCLGRYEIVGLIGAGGMGEVYRARDGRMKRDVALKVLPRSFTRDRERIARFEREGRLAGALNHPNIVSVHDVGEENGTYYIVSELVDGATLQKLMSKGAMAPRQAIPIAVQIAEGLEGAHAVGVVHRDLKPGNVMVTRDGRVKILDFGLARRQPAKLRVNETATEEVTETGAVMGTAGYMSPEQIRGENVDHRSDIFSFGLIVHEMLSGKQTFGGASSVEVMNAILTQEPAELPPAVPPSLARLITRCLEKSLARRFQSAADLGFALRALTTDPPAAGARQTRLPWRGWVAVLTVGLACGGLGYWWKARSPSAGTGPESIFRRLTNDSGLTTGAAISNDGKFVVYASDRGNPGNLDIYVQPVDGGASLRITDDPADDYDPAFSADGTQIFFRSDRRGGGIFAASVLGGEARLLVPEGRRPRLSPDGQRLLYWTGPEGTHDTTGSGDAKIWQRRLSGGDAIQIGKGCRLFENTLVWSPDSSRILFIGICGSDLLRHDPENKGISAWVASADGKSLTPNRALYGTWPTMHAGAPVIDQWVADPPRLLIPILVGDASSITAVPVSIDGTKVEGPPQRVMFAGGQATRVSSSANGRMVLSTAMQESHIWSLPVDRNGTATGGPTQLTSGAAGETHPVLSADGKKLAYLSDRANGIRLFYKDLETGREKEVSTEGYRYATPVFNREGTKIMCVQYPSAVTWQNFIFEVPVSGGISRKVRDREVWSWLEDWSPDGSALLLVGGRLLDLDAQTITPLVDPAENAGWGTGGFHFSHNGRWISFEKKPALQQVGTPAYSEVFIVPFRKALVTRAEWISIVPRSMGFSYSPHFSADDRLVFFVSRSDGRGCLWAQRLNRDMRPEGKPFAVYHAHDYRHQLHEIAAGPDAVVFDREDSAGNVWLLEPGKQM